MFKCSKLKKELVVATKNKKKLEEIREILKPLRLKISSLADYPKPPRIIENGKTFRENAIKKAVRIARFTRKMTLGEDSGLCVDILGGKPGVYSSRFSGKGKSDRQNNSKLLKLLGGLPVKKRKAHYCCAVALADKDGLVGVTEGKCSGFIGFTGKGHFGFGYDPLFVIPKYQKTFAQLGPAVKHKMSHRFRALRKTKPIISTCLK
ncbi:MAG: RdgB/HAM1 family non-canonical purine NTP pyrophosphatase [Candidatus Omnitrophica bacterium]|nr:RdgB/HAM1 family non-canonical purine NTP pyrophosphatase [Candidatus Omnitrophota bacterium]MDD5592798.1 RdgB/HAM1 family non-canonical purine NTP pyrophosphatase [Candidatus Omnitrophota bacterium]